MMSKDTLTIAGCGAAASFLALRSMQLGFAPTLLRAQCHAFEGIEIIPASAGPLLQALQLDEAIADVSPGHGEGLFRRRLDGSSDVAPGRSLHVDRLKFRRRLVAEAVRRGARICDVDRLPPGDPLQFCVDATGQRAAWSRPVVRRGRQMADIFALEAGVAAGTARLAILREGWAYLASDQNATTVGVISNSKASQKTLEKIVCETLGLPTGGSYRFIGRRPAFLQWAARPFVGRRLAIGDAAFHHNPIGGRGLAFALGSAFAAATALASFRDDLSAERNARAYYESYVAAEIRRHIAFLDGTDDPPSAPVTLPARIRWIAPVVRDTLAVDAKVVSGPAFSLASGQKVRWTGNFDLLVLRGLISGAEATNSVAQRLQALRLSGAEAHDLLVWALSRGLVEAAD